MKIKVNPHEIEFTQDIEINAGEYNITTLEFEFSEEYEGLTNMAVFSTCENSYKAPIFNNQCVIPYEVLEETGNVLLGVYGYEGDEELTLRYSPTPKYFHVVKGSYREAGDPELPPKSEWEQVVELINQAITETNNLNIAVEKEGSITTITLTKKDGTTQTVQVEDGKSLEFKWEGTSLGVRQEGQSEYQYVDLKGDRGDPGAIKMQIVNTLPTTGQEDTIYLVPIQDPETGNNYDEYIYVNGAWEKLGGVQVEVDLTDYVKNTDYASTSKGGVIKTQPSYGISITNDGYLYGATRTYSQYTSGNDGIVVSKGTLENVITGKGLVSNTSYANGTTAGVIKTNNCLSVNSSGAVLCDTLSYANYSTAQDWKFISKGTLENVLTARIGDIETLLEVLDVGSGARELE